MSLIEIMSRKFNAAKYLLTVYGLLVSIDGEKAKKYLEESKKLLNEVDVLKSNLNETEVNFDLDIKKIEEEILNVDYDNEHLSGDISVI